MSKEQDIVKFIKRNQFHIGMFFWVKAIVINLPSVSIKSAIELFVKHFGFLGENHSVDALVAEYHRMNNEIYIEMQKT